MRKIELTPERQKLIYEALAAGNTYRAAAESAGVSYSTFRTWMRLGKRETEGPNSTLFHAVKKAEAEAGIASLGRIRQAAHGGAVCTARNKWHPSPSFPMSENVRPFEWTAQREQAALLVADGQWTLTQIATQIGMEERQVRRWKKDVAFAARVEQLRAEYAVSLEDCAIARKVRRIKAMQERWERMQAIALGRADQYATDEAFGKTAPEGKTGLIVCTVKSVGSGDNCQVIQEFAIDVRLMRLFRELRELEKQAAIECGQWGKAGGN